MTPEEKAEELIRNFENNVSTNYVNMSITSSIQCARILVEEMMKANFKNEDDHVFWVNVRNEINKFSWGC